jgi:hypothetical protein
VSRADARMLAGAALYAFLVFAGTAVLGFVVVPFVAHRVGWFPIETEAQAAFSLLTLGAVPFLVGLSTVAALAYPWILQRSWPLRVAAYCATALAAWMIGAAISAFLFG